MKFLLTFENFEKSVNLEEPKSDGLKDIKMGSKGNEVLLLQKALDKLGFKLIIYGIDSKFGYETLGVCKSLFEYLKNHSEFRDYVDNDSLLDIKNNTITVEQLELIQELSEEDDLRKEIAEYFKKVEENISNIDLIGKKDILKNISNPEEFIKKLVDISKKLQINPNWLLLVMWKESRINPKAINKSGGASGLIQFMPQTAKGLGTSVDNIRSMDGVEQLTYVYKYFQPFTGKIKSVQDLYLVTFFPVALSKNDDFILQTDKLSAELIAKENPVIDLNKDGKIKKSEFNDYVMKGIPSNWIDKI